MREKIVKLLKLRSDSNRIERTRKWVEIRLNFLLFDHKPVRAGTVPFEEFLDKLSLKDSGLFDLLKSGGEAEEAVHWVRTRFQQLARENRNLPFPSSYNADQSLALLSYALARHLRPPVVVETGVCYGITSTLVLLALERNNFGELVSIDLPSLFDPHGSYVGLAVPDRLKGRWRLHLGSSRRYLPIILSHMPKIGLFILDSATVYTTQRYEYKALYPNLLRGGAALFNNIGSKFQVVLSSTKCMEFYSIWQLEKPSCATGLLLSN